MKDFIRDHEDGVILLSTVIIIAALAGIVVTASGKALVMEVDGLSSSKQDSEGNIEEKHAEGGRFKFYAE